MLTKILTDLKMEEFSNLQFIDEFPVVSEALSPEAIKGVHHYSEVMGEIVKEFHSFQG